MKKWGGLFLWPLESASIFLMYFFIFVNVRVGALKIKSEATVIKISGAKAKKRFISPNPENPKTCIGIITNKKQNK